MRERLLGAAVLVLAAVLIVPMLLDGPDEDQGQVSRELELPAREANAARTHVVELDTAGRDGAQDTTPAPVDQVAVSSPDPVESADGTDGTEIESIGEAAGGIAAEPRRSAPPPDVAQQTWAVQVGSFTSESNARRLEELLKASDYPAFVMRSVVQGRVMYRVRVGPEPDRVSAELLADRLRADRQSTQLVEHP